MTPNKSELVRAAGTTLETLDALVGAVREQGGSDADLRRLRSNKSLRDDVARLLVCSRIPPMRTLAGMIAAGRYDWVSKDIIEPNFAVDPARFTIEGCHAFHFGMTMRNAEAEALIRKEGYELATIEHLLAYGAENPDEQREFPIACLASSWANAEGRRCRPSLFGQGSQRCLGLVQEVSADGGLGPTSRVLAVRQAA